MAGNGQGNGEVCVIGAGLAGLVAGWRAAERGRQVEVIAKGWGTLYWHAGCIDVLGYYPFDNPHPVRSPVSALKKLNADQPQHPYTLVGQERLAEAVQALQALCAAVRYPLLGSLEKNWLLPSAVGTFRPTCLAPETMIAGDLSHNAPMLIVGFQNQGDFFPALVADNLTRQGIPATHIILELRTLAERNFNNATFLARMMEDSVFRAELVDKLKPRVGGDVERIGFPAILGLGNSLEVKEALETRLRRPVFEIPSLTPSIPGMRLHSILVQAIQRCGGRVHSGMQAVGAQTNDQRVTAVYTEAAARRRSHRYDRYVLATGGILGGGITTNYKGEVREVVFDLPVTAPASRLDWFARSFLDQAGHPIYQSGLTVDDQFRPVGRLPVGRQSANGNEQPIYENLYTAGGALAHAELIRERSLEGVALATGYAVGEMV
jgi:glycerol-3-phosphate dehydrogenase subunit B